MARVEYFSKLFPRRYNDKGKPVCRYCGGEFTNKRSRSFCCTEHANMACIETNPKGYDHLTFKYLGSNCLLCGADRKIETYYGDKYKLEIHHIIHIKDGGTNKLENLCGLCHDCHVRVHKLCRMVDKILNETQGELIGF